jgi:hypothetical protein
MFSVLKMEIKFMLKIEKKNPIRNKKKGGKEKKKENIEKR